jgi:hypothetical protein
MARLDIHYVFDGVAMRFQRQLFCALCCLALSALFAACSFDTNPGSSFAGQTCFEESDCAAGLTCRERRCRPISGEQPTDAGLDSVEEDTSEEDTTEEDTTQNDTSEECTQFDTRCGEDGGLEICGRDGRWSDSECPGGTTCQDGECIGDTTCTDSDGDGYFGGEGCPDCNDNDRNINPGAEEDCETPVDDNCNGAINEGCETECCPGGCADNEVCSVCECVEYDPGLCTTTGQPCDEPGQFVNGFFCSEDFFDQPRCVGVCDTTAEDPDSTCPQEGTVCSFGQDGNQGICLEGCFLDRGCSTPGFGCLPVGDTQADGICVPTDENNKIGDPCDPNQTFACEAGAFCINLGQGQATCQQACRPFEDENGTDCDSGHCFPFSPTLGVCQEDATVNNDGTCTQPQNAFRPCEEDATICVNTGGFGGSRCFDMCRVELGNADCGMGRNCRDTGDIEGVGFCTRGGGGF